MRLLKEATDTCINNFVIAGERSVHEIKREYGAMKGNYNIVLPWELVNDRSQVRSVAMRGCDTVCSRYENFIV